MTIVTGKFYVNKKKYFNNFYAFIQYINHSLFIVIRINQSKSSKSWPWTLLLELCKIKYISLTIHVICHCILSSTINVFEKKCVWTIVFQSYFITNLIVSQVKIDLDLAYKPRPPGELEAELSVERGWSHNDWLLARIHTESPMWVVIVPIRKNNNKEVKNYAYHKIYVTKHNS